MKWQESDYMQVLDNMIKWSSEDIARLLEKSKSVALTPVEREDLLYSKGKEYAASRARDYYIAIHEMQEDTQP